jgi:pSer/pThr/pTyr-binding forkhead associated (FHA) protein
MRCPKCGFENKESAVICAECQEPLEQKKRQETTVILPPSEVVEEDVQEVEAIPTEKPLLVVTRGPYAGQKFELSTGEFTVGRDPGSDIFLDDITVSRRHAKLIIDEGKVVIVDSGSLNGTYVNRKRVEQKALKSGDELQIGKFKMLFLSQKSEAERQV